MNSSRSVAFFTFIKIFWCSNSTSKDSVMESNHWIRGNTTQHELLMRKIGSSKHRCLWAQHHHPNKNNHLQHIQFLDMRIYIMLVWFMMPGLVSSHPHLLTSMTVFQRMKIFFHIFNHTQQHIIKTILG